MDKNIRCNKILRIPLGTLNYLGFAFFKDDNYVIIKVLISYTILALYVLYNIAEFVFLYVNRNDFYMVTVNGSTAFLTITIYSKGFNYIFYRKQFEDLCTRMDTKMAFYQKHGNNKEKDIMKKCCKESENVLWIIKIAIAITVVLFIISLTLNFFILFE